MKIDWETATAGRDVFAQKHSSLIFCADWAPVRAFADPLLHYPGSLYGAGLKEALAGADYRIVNVEAVLGPVSGDLQPLYKEGPNLIGPGGAVEDLCRLGFDIALLANNHTYDFGAAGLSSTREAIESTGMRVCGCGSSQEDAYDGVVLETDPHPVALVNFQEGEEGRFPQRAPELAGWDLERVCASIRQHVAAGRRVIALPHADREFLPLPAPYVQEAYRRLADAGAAMVIAHHPHVPRGIEIHKGVPICYSQGNFLFWQDHAGLFRKLGYIVKVGIGPSGRLGFQLIPYRIDRRGLHLLNRQQFAWFMEQLKDVSGEQLLPEQVRAWWDAAIDAISHNAWYESCTGMDYGMNRMKERDPVGLARLRTRLSSPAHYEFMTAGISRILAGDHGKSPSWMVEKVRLWSEREEKAFPLFA